MSRPVLLAIDVPLADVLEALRPFAEMAEGRDKWPADKGCGTFPTVAQVRRARDVYRRLDVAAAPPVQGIGPEGVWINDGRDWVCSDDCMENIGAWGTNYDIGDDSGVPGPTICGYCGHQKEES